MGAGRLLVPGGLQSPYLLVPQPTEGGGMKHASDFVLACQLPWWRPAKLAVFLHGSGWRTRTDLTPLEAVELGPVAVSPLDQRGKAHFIAWDIDTGNESHVRALRDALPSRVRKRLWVTYSGKKGWHLWLFLAEPIAAEKAARFARKVAKRAGFECEVFPSSVRSKCLKWPGQPHPDTGVLEEFVDPRWLRNTERLDTKIILELLHHGEHRISPKEILEVLRRWEHGNQETGVARRKRRAGEVPKRLHDTAKEEMLSNYLMRLIGRAPAPLERKFLCVVHEEKRESAAFHRAEDGRILYHDWHGPSRGAPEWLTLAELYAALKTGRIAKLDRVEGARLLAELSLRAGPLNPDTRKVRRALEATTKALSTSGVLSLGTPKKQRDLLLVDLVVKQVWWTLCFEFLIRSEAGFGEVNMSTRFLASRASISKKSANRTLNLLCTLGVLRKKGTIAKGYQFELLEPAPEEVQRLWDLLGNPSLDEFNRTLVEQRLGLEVAVRVFRRTRPGVPVA